MSFLRVNNLNIKKPILPQKHIAKMQEKKLPLQEQKDEFKKNQKTMSESCLCGVELKQMANKNKQEPKGRLLFSADAPSG